MESGKRALTPFLLSFLFLARAAARAVIGAEEKEKLVTKADLRAELAELKVDIAELKAEVQAMLNRQL
jgi:hypothetical protein